MVYVLSIKGTLADAVAALENYVNTSFLAANKTFCVVTVRNIYQFFKCEIKIPLNIITIIINIIYKAWAVGLVYYIAT